MGVLIIGLNLKNISGKADILKIAENYDYNFQLFLNVYKDLKKNNPMLEATLISTCLRFELLFYSPQAASFLLKIIHGPVKKYLETIAAHVNVKIGGDIFFAVEKEALTHLFRTAAGFESEDIGEIQVLGQIKDSFKNCRNSKISEKNINRILSHVLKAAGKIRDKVPAFSDRSHVVNNIIKSIEKNISLCNFIEKSSSGIDIAGLNYLVIGSGKLIDSVLYKLSQLNCMNISVISGNGLSGSGLAARIKQSDVIILNVDKIEYFIDDSCFVNDLKKEFLIFDLSISRNINPELRKNENINLYIIDDLISGPDSSSSAGVRIKRSGDKNFVKIAENIINTGVTAALKSLSKSEKISGRPEFLINAQTQIIENEFEKTIKNLINSGHCDPVIVKKIIRLKNAVIKKITCANLNAPF